MARVGTLAGAGLSSMVCSITRTMTALPGPVQPGSLVAGPRLVLSGISHTNYLFWRAVHFLADQPLRIHIEPDARGHERGCRQQVGHALRAARTGGGEVHAR